VDESRSRISHLKIGMYHWQNPFVFRCRLRVISACSALTHLDFGEPIIASDQRNCLVHVDKTGAGYCRTVMRVRVSSKGRILLPAELRRQDDIEPGQKFDVQRIRRGEYRLVRQKTPPNDGLVEWLLACNVKGYFRRIKSESTNAI
jgi:AbrB family looped-hinge helix DNA binding protein